MNVNLEQYSDYARSNKFLNAFLSFNGSKLAKIGMEVRIKSGDIVQEDIEFLKKNSLINMDKINEHL